MDPKSYLKLYKQYENRISMIEMEIEAVNNEIDSIKIQLDGMPKGSKKSDRVGELSSLLADMAEDLAAARYDAWMMRKHIFKAIADVPDMREQKILYLRYIYGMEWDEIAEEMDLTRQWVNTLHGRGLEAVGKSLQFINFNNCF